MVPILPKLRATWSCKEILALGGVLDRPLPGLIDRAAAAFGHGAGSTTGVGSLAHGRDSVQNRHVLLLLGLKSESP